MGARPPFQFVTNTLSLAREALLGMVSGALDAKRTAAWREYGYPEEISFAKLLSAYERGGLAQGAVHRLLDGCWQQLPRIKSPASDEESAWEKKLAKAFKDGQLWAKLRDLDRRNMVGRYAAIIYRAADGKLLSEPLQRAQKLVDIIPVYESQIKVTRWHEDQRAENYGLPAMFQIETSKPGADDQARPRTWVDVHPSRVQVLAEGAVGANFFEGTPLLRAGFNALIDVEKITGGSGESFLKNSARTVVFQYAPEANVEAITAADGNTGKSVREIHEEQTKSLNQNIDSSIVIKGGEANTLQTTIADPTGPFSVAVSVFAASVRIPTTILIGQQTGRLASDEDRKDFNERCKARQDNELTPMIEQFVRRMQDCGVIDAGEFEVEWPQLGAPTDTEKLDHLTKMTAAMQQASNAGLMEPIFDANELRKTVGFEERADDGMPTEEDLLPPDPAVDPTKPAPKQPRA